MSNAAPNTVTNAKPEQVYVSAMSWREREARCCEEARVRYNCWCSFVVDCPRHGEKHVGTHD